MKTQISSILIPTDFSELSESALKVGLAIAKRQHAKVTLLHVVDTYAHIQPTEVFLPEFQVTPDVISAINVRLNDLVERINQDTGIDITGTVVDGIPSDRICLYARQKKINLIVMGTHGISGLRKFFLGSEAFKVIKNASCPVLTIPGNWQKTDFEKVLFPVRLKPGALNKYFYARPIIEKNNSEVTILGLAEQKRPEDIKEVTLLMDKLKVQLHNDNVLFRSSLCASEDFPATIINAAIENETDLIILTANIDYYFKTFFMGPFAQQVVNHSHLPVLSIKPSKSLSENPSSMELARKWGKSVLK
jgi:nucleotide-binding universal stress UspA family protein